MSKPVKAWAIKGPTTGIDLSSIALTEEDAWWCGSMQDTEENMKREGYRAVRVEVREVGE